MIGSGLLVLSGVVCFARLPATPFEHGPRKPSSSSLSMTAHETFMFSNRSYLAFCSPFNSTKERKNFLPEAQYLGDIREGIGSPNDRLLAGVGVGGCGNHIDHPAIVSSVVPGADAIAALPFFLSSV